MDFYETPDGPVPALIAPDESAVVLGNWWRPSAAFVAELAQSLSGRRVLEVFAGNGHMASLLHKRGIEVTATSYFQAHDDHDRGLYFPVIDMEAADAVAKYGNDHDVLLMSWPVASGAALRAAIKWGAEKDIVFLGEVTDYTVPFLGGCASDRFFEHVRPVSHFACYVARMYEQAFIGRYHHDPIPLPGKKPFGA
jgi:hypothetical protein